MMKFEKTHNIKHLWEVGRLRTTFNSLQKSLSQLHYFSRDRNHQRLTVALLLLLTALWFYPDIRNFVYDRMIVGAADKVVVASEGAWQYQHTSRTFKVWFGKKDTNTASWKYQAEPAKVNPLKASGRVGIGQWLKERYFGKPTYQATMVLESLGYRDTTEGQLLKLLVPRLEKIQASAKNQVPNSKKVYQQSWDSLMKQSSAPQLTIDPAATEAQQDQVLFINGSKDFGVLYTVLPNQGVKEEIIIYQTPSMDKECMQKALSTKRSSVFTQCPLPYNQYTFSMQADAGVQLSRTAEGVWYLADKQGRYLGHFANLIAADGKGVKTNNLSLSLEPASDQNQARLTITMDLAWMMDPTRVYPIQIDPSIIYDETSEFATGTFDRSRDSGSGASPRVESGFKKLTADGYTVGLWHMDEASGNLTDSSGNSLTGTNNNTTVVAGVNGNGRSFNGTTSYVSVADTAILDIYKELTIEAWIYPTAAAIGEVVAKWGTQDSYILRYNANQTISFYIDEDGIEGNYRTVTTTATVGLNAWHHIAGVFNGSSSIIYLDGHESARVSFGTTYSIFNSSEPVYIGENPDASALFFTGSIDEVRLSSVARTADEIKANAERNPWSYYGSPVLDLLSTPASLDSLAWTENGVMTGDGETLFSTTGLVAQWNFNSTSGTTATADAGSCGATCNGTLTTFASTGSQDAAARTGWTALNKRWGAGALMFDGTDDYVLGTDVTVFDGATALTWGGWILPTSYAPGTSTGDIRSIITKSDLSSAATDTFNSFFQGNGAGTYQFVCGLSNGTSAVTAIINAPTYFPLYEWTYYLCTWSSGSGVSVYVNGRLIATSGTISGSLPNTAATLRLGSSTNASEDRFAGVMDSMVVFSRALGEAEILSNYNAGNIQFQTRSGTDNTPDDGGWEAWTPVTGETQIESFDTNEANQSIFNAGIATLSTNMHWIKLDNTLPGNSDTTGTNGRIPLANTAGRGDTNATLDPFVMKDGSTYRMWYTGFDGTTYRTYYASSSDGYTWTKLDNTIPTASNTTSTNGRIPLGTTGTGDDGNVLRVSVIRDGATYKMWYSGNDGTYWRIYYATSPDAVNWTKYDNTIPANSDTTGTNGRIPLGSTAGRSDINSAYAPSVIKDGSTYKMWYTGVNGSGVGTILYATSSDGLTWTKQSNVVQAATNGAGSLGRISQGTTGRLDSGGLDRITVMKDGSLYKAWLTGTDGTNARLHYATSLDGLVWVKQDNTIPAASNRSNTNGRLTLGSSGGDTTALITGSVIKDNGAYRMWYTGSNGTNYRTYYASSNTATITQTTSTTILREGAGSERFQFGLPQPDGGTAGIWHFEETGGTGAYIRDPSIYANHGTPTGTTVTKGIMGLAREFNGSSDRITIPATSGSLDIDASPLTMEAWVSTDSVGAVTSIINRGSNGGVGYGMNLTATGTVNCSGHGSSAFASTTALQPNRWYHLACVLNGSSSIVYINGVRDATGLVAPIAATTEVIIGANWNGSTYINYFDGKIDEVRISNYERTGEEIAESYRQGRDQHINRAITSVDLNSSNLYSFWVAGERPGSYLSAYLSESPVYHSSIDASVRAFWHMDDLVLSQLPVRPPGTGANLGGIGSVAWTNPGNALASDNAQATSSLNNNASQYLRASNFNFTIPFNATISGIEVRIERNAAVTNRIRDNQVRLVNSAGTVGTTARENTGLFWPTTDTVAIYGGPDDLWGVAWTPSDITTVNFGAVVSAINTVATATVASVDFIQISIYYSYPTLKDSGLYAAHGTYSNGAVRTQGKLGQAYDFDGTDDYILIPDNDALSATNWTSEAWVQFDTLGSNVLIAGKLNEYWISYNNTSVGCTASRLGFSIYDGDWICASSTFTPVVGRWYYVVGTYDGTNLRLYINGQLESGPTAQGVPSNNATSAYIGGYSAGSNTLDGQIDEVRFSASVRSAQEIRQTYEYVQHQHRVTIDFGAKLDGATITGCASTTSCSDTSFAIDGTVFGALNKGDNLYPGDVIIIKENYNGTEYLAQGTVATVTSGGAVTLSGWSSCSSACFPDQGGGTYGFTANAYAFKWQQEFVDLSEYMKGTGSGDSTNQRNAIAYLDFRVTSNGTPAHFFLDDARYVSNYLTTPAGSTMITTPQRYVQYRGLFSSSDSSTSSWLNQTQLNYTNQSATNDLLMRHGKWFGNGQKQPYWWTQ